LRSAARRSLGEGALAFLRYWCDGLNYVMSPHLTVRGAVQAPPRRGRAASSAKLAFVIKLPQPLAEQAAAIYVKAFYKPWRCMSLTTCLIAREPRSGDRPTMPKRQNYQHKQQSRPSLPRAVALSSSRPKSHARSATPKTPITRASRPRRLE